MQQQRTIYSNLQEKNSTPAGMVTVAAIGAQHHVLPGRSVDTTLKELGLTPEPYQVVRVNAQEVRDLLALLLKANDTVTISNVVRGGS